MCLKRGAKLAKKPKIRKSMYLEKITVVDFKNHEFLQVDFCRDINCLVGLNGCGKTNLLDAVFYLSFTKSAFNLSDFQNIRHGVSGFSIAGVFRYDNSRSDVRVTVQHGKKKSVKVDGKTVKKASRHVGRFPVILVAPGDVGLITEGSEMRRKMLDMLLSQMDGAYLEQLMIYTKALKHRNKLLKQFAENRITDPDQLEPYDYIILQAGKRIADTRALFISRFEPLLQKHFNWISNGREMVRLQYRSSFLNEDYKFSFQNALEKDLLLQRTTEGVHRDDIIFEMNGYPLKKYGSQGQQKSYIIALKLAQFDLLVEEKGFKPILLLDDIFDKLDDERIGKLVDLIEEHTFGQVFITDARPERTWHFLSGISSGLKVFQVGEGMIKELNS